MGYEAQIIFTLDTICPWTYLAKKRLDEARYPSTLLRSLPFSFKHIQRAEKYTAIRIVREKTPPEKATFSLKFSPYQLYPGQSQEGEDEYEWYKREKYNDSEDQMKKFSALMDAYGVPSGISFDFHGTIANTINAHRLIQHYQEEPQGSPELANKIVDALYKAYFHSEAHPSAKETLLTAATEAGVPAADAEAFIDDESEGLQDVKMLIREQAMNGVDSVPTVVFEGKRRDLTLTGAKEIPEYVKTMEQIIKESE